jgi:PmbA protein
MNREILQHTQRTIKLGITASAIDSVRSGEETTTVARLYDGEHIGIASAVGRYDESQLTEQANQALRLGIPYPGLPNGDHSERFCREGHHYTTAELITFTEGLLRPLKEAFPHFLLSYGVSTVVDELTIKNDRGLDLGYSSTHTQVALVAKERGSPNIFDTFAGIDGANLTLDGTLDTIEKNFRAYSNDLGKAPGGRQRVVFAGEMSTQPLFQLFQTHCTAPKYAKGASVFSGKLNDASIGFHDDFRLVDSRDHHVLPVCPFDIEGTLRPERDLVIVGEGALRAVATSRKDAAKYNLPANGSATGKLTHPPGSGVSALRVLPTVSRLRELLDDEPAILVWFQAGGNSDQKGDLAIPAMTLFQIDRDGNLQGRYAPCTLSGSLYTIFGTDFVGVSEEGFNPFSNDNYLVTHLTVQG